ncbi:MAG TPA: glycosyltransferase family 2 protein [Gammaproteobacteria bacterium]|nr:glycosyltransferase family 2 protein [Gammaproteobacteria bacterium]
MNQTPVLSVVIPLYNEAACIEPLHQSLQQVLNGAGYSYEILFVDDGSLDATFQVASDIAFRDRHVRVIKLRKNFGQTPAFSAGIDHARGELLVTMDGDLQNDPEDIPRLLDKIAEGYDVVVGWRHDRQDALLTRKIPSMLANRLIGVVTGIPIHDNGCSLKAFRGEIAHSMPLYSDMHRFMPAAASMRGARIAEIRVRHHPRRYGVSKYGLSRIYKVVLDLLGTKTIVSFAAKPLHWFSLLAVPFGMLGIGLLVYGLVVAGEQDANLFPLVGSGLLFFMLATLLIVTGMLAELISRTTTNRQISAPAVCARQLTADSDQPAAGSS